MTVLLWYLLRTFLYFYRYLFRSPLRRGPPYPIPVKWPRALLHVAQLPGFIGLFSFQALALEGGIAIKTTSILVLVTYSLSLGVRLERSPEPIYGPSGDL